MTAEIAIANQTAVALAADSAMTVAGGKIYNGAEKLFRLSETEPVAVMIYGNVSLLSLPWETIIKEYRKDLGTKSFAKLSSYRNDFIRYVEKKNFFSMDEKNQMIFMASIEIFSEIKQALESEVNEIVKGKGGNVNVENTMGLLASIINERCFYLNNLPFSDRYTESHEQTLRRRSVSVIKKAADEVFQKLPITRNMRSRLYDIVVFAHTRRDWYSDLHTGVVIAGFGKDELYPAIYTTIVDGMVSNRLKCALIHELSGKLSPVTTATIIPFAQQEMVYTFMEGIDPDLLVEQQNEMKYFSEKIPDEIDFSTINASKKQQELIRSLLFQKTKSMLDEMQYHLIPNPQIEISHEGFGGGFAD